ncbi:MAG: endolytic transglycosylase MltG [Solirubrobacterales bacterium]
MSDEWPGGDPFADPNDPAAREREERRLEREERRRKREAKRSEKGAAAPPPPPEPKAPAEPAPAPRTPEQEFWEEEPGIEEPAAEDAGAPAGAAEEGLEAEPDREIWGVPEEHDPAMARGAARNGRGRRGGEGGGVLGVLRRHPFRIFAAIAALFVAWFLFSLFQPFHGDGSGKVQVTIPKGSSVSEVGDLLGEKDVIDSSTLFQIRVTLAGKRSSLYAGHFTLAHGMSYGAAIDALSTPPVKRTTAVTIPEGYTRSQAAQLVEEDGIPGSYTKATVKSRYLNPAQYGGKGAKDLEGFLFPDTFELKPKAPVADLVQLQLGDFKRRIKGVDMKYAKSKNLTVYDVLIIASMVEDEAGVASQRKLVAAVIYNRLHEGMPLGIDATIRFATGNYTDPLTESELAIDSPYNTRTNAGLPPGPINSPGLDAIEAAAHPAKKDFLFYVTDPNSCNELAFSKSEAEFEHDVAKYNAAREANGGNAPSTCGE